MKSTALGISLLLIFFASTALCQTATRAEFEQFSEAHGGRWVGEVTWTADWPGLGKKGDKVTAYFESRPSADGNTLVYSSYRGHETAVGMIFYDPGTKQIRQVGVNSGGTVHRGIYFKEGGAFKYSGIGALADGTKTEANMRVVVSDGGETHNWRGTVIVDGKEAEKLNDVWRRVRKPR